MIIYNNKNQLRLVSVKNKLYEDIYFHKSTMSILGLMIDCFYI